MRILDFCIRYVTFLDRLIIDGIKWFINSKDTYYVVMCSLPFIGTVITILKNHIRDGLKGEEERTDI